MQNYWIPSGFSYLSPRPVMSHENWVDGVVHKPFLLNPFKETIE